MYQMLNTQLHIQNSQNPFPCNLDAAHDAFFQTLAAVQRQKLDQGQIGRVYRDTIDDLDRQWKNLQELASDGLIEQVRLQLDGFIKEYAAQKALYQFLEGGASGWTLTPQTPGLSHAVAEKLGRKHSHLSSLLVQILSAGMRAREEAQTKAADHVAQARMEQAEQGIEREFERNRELHSLVMHTLATLEASSSRTPQQVFEAHQDARASLQLAIETAARGTQQFQDAFPLLLDPVVKVVQSANELVQTNNQHLQEHLPSFIEAGVTRADQRRRSHRLFWVVATPIILGVLGLIAFALVQFL